MNVSTYKSRHACKTIQNMWRLELKKLYLAGKIKGREVELTSTPAVSTGGFIFKKNKHFKYIKV